MVNDGLRMQGLFYSWFGLQIPFIKKLTIGFNNSILIMINIYAKLNKIQIDR